MFYHCTSAQLLPGYKLAPGSWGRVVLRYGPRHDHFKHEEALELARREIAPLAVSRLSAFYACTTQQAAVSFLQAENRIIDQIYRVAPEGGYFMLSDMSLSRPPKENQEGWANSYWMNSLLIHVNASNDMISKIKLELRGVLDLASPEIHAEISGLMSGNHFAVHHAVRVHLYPQAQDLSAVRKTLHNTEVLCRDPVVIKEVLELPKFPLNDQEVARVSALLAP